eukprot:SAG31_NODE_815_length_11876_cov_2.189182_10_plen_185_part_00
MMNKLQTAPEEVAPPLVDSNLNLSAARLAALSDEVADIVVRGCEQSIRKDQRSIRAKFVQRGFDSARHSNHQQSAVFSAASDGARESPKYERGRSCTGSSKLVPPAHSNFVAPYTEDLRTSNWERLSQTANMPLGQPRRQHRALSSERSSHHSGVQNGAAERVVGRQRVGTHLKVSSLVLCCFV